MDGRRTTFAAELAPCGKTVGGECYREDDGEGLVIYDQVFTCGCRRGLGVMRRRGALETVGAAAEPHRAGVAIAHDVKPNATAGDVEGIGIDPLICDGLIRDLERAVINAHCDVFARNVPLEFA